MATIEKSSQREVLEAQVAQFEADRAAAAATIEALRAREAELRVTGFRNDPSKRPDDGGATSEIARTVKEREKTERSLRAIDANIVAAAQAIQETCAGEAAAMFEAALAGARELNQHERAIMAELAEHRAAFYVTYEELRALYAEKQDFWRRWALADEGQVNQLRHELRPVWDPPARTAVDAFDKLTIEADGAADQPNVWVHLTVTEETTLEDKRNHYNLVAAGRANRSKQPLPYYPELMPPRADGEPEPEPQAQASEDVPDEPGATADVAINKHGRRRFRGRSMRQGENA